MPSLLSTSLPNAVVNQDYELSVTKKCSKCQLCLPLSEFSKKRRSLSGYNNVCKKCDNYRKKKQRKQKKDLFQSMMPGAVYFIINQYKLEHVKIGFTTNLTRRLEEFFTSTSGKIGLLALVETENDSLERSLHKQFQDLRISSDSEWFLAKSSLLDHLSKLNQDLAHQSLIVLPPAKQTRVIVPNMEKYIDCVPFV